MKEQILYTDNSVHITTARIIIHGTTYALRNITSVRRIMKPSNPAGIIIMVILGFLFGLGFIGSMLGEEWATALIMGVMVTVISALTVFMAKTRKPTYYLSLSGNSGEGNVLPSYDRAYINKIVNKVNDAIVQYH